MSEFKEKLDDVLRKIVEDSYDLGFKDAKIPGSGTWVDRENMAKEIMQLIHDDCKFFSDNLSGLSAASCDKQSEPITNSEALGMALRFYTKECGGAV